MTTEKPRTPDLIPCRFCGMATERNVDSEDVVFCINVDCDIWGVHVASHTWNTLDPAAMLAAGYVPTSDLEKLFTQSEIDGVRQQALEEAEAACTNVIKTYDVLKPDGKTYEPLRVQKAAKDMVALAREDITALMDTKETDNE